MYSKVCNTFDDYDDKLSVYEHAEGVKIDESISSTIWLLSLIRASQ